MREENSRIVKNTGLLYIRLIFLTIINLYSVRVTFEALGDIDYGIYNMIASIAGALSILTGAMTSASQRFLSVHLGKYDYGRYSHTFTMLIISFFITSVIVIVIGEALGYLFIEHWLKIPSDRVTASYWVYQASLMALIFSLMTIPYTSSIVANEKMDAFAAFSVVEGVLRLAIVLILLHSGGDRLELYGFLTAIISIIIFLMSMQYCHVKFKYCKYIWKWDKELFKQLTNYTGWNLFGSISAMLATQGQNILLGIFFGPLINVAKGTADKIMHVISGFSTNLYMAVSPQIIKSYAAEDYVRANNLVLKTSKLAFLLIFILSFPLICNMQGLLNLWLPQSSVSEDMVSFSKLILLYCMIISLESPISRIIQATGKIKKYQLSVGVITLSFIPTAALILWMGGKPVMTIVVQIVIISIAQIVRVIVAHNQVGLDYVEYLKTVVISLCKVAIVAIPIYFIFEINAPTTKYIETILYTILSGLLGMTIAILLGLNKTDRVFIKEIINGKQLKNVVNL